jgi:hypothetical protein
MVDSTPLAIYGKSKQKINPVRTEYNHSLLRPLLHERIDLVRHDRLKKKLHPRKELSKKTLHRKNYAHEILHSASR